MDRLRGNTAGVLLMLYGLWALRQVRTLCEGPRLKRSGHPCGLSDQQIILLPKPDVRLEANFPNDRNGVVMIGRQLPLWHPVRPGAVPLKASPGHGCFAPTPDFEIPWMASGKPPFVVGENETAP